MRADHLMQKKEHPLVHTKANCAYNQKLLKALRKYPGAGRGLRPTFDREHDAR
jgi:hypothetical protein